MTAAILMEINNLIDTKWDNLPQMIPASFLGTISVGDEFIAVEIQFTSEGQLFYSGGREYNGYIRFNIFTKVGDGQLRAMEISDKLSVLVQGTTLDSGLQFFQSNPGVSSVDSENTSLLRTEHLTQFKTYGDL